MTAWEDDPAWHALVGRLRAEEVITADLGRHFIRVPRAAHTPDRVWFPEGRWTCRRRDPGQWHEAVTSDIPLTTQVDDGTERGDGQPSSSSSMPSVVARMLALLDPQVGDRVLEIGTGTGWTTALLADCGTTVTSVEVDENVAADARARLTRQDAHAELVVGDGEKGHPASAPYDRVHATAAVQHIPAAWIEQTRPGGTIVAPFGTPFCNGALLRLTVHQDGTAQGRFTGNAAFMWLRGHRPQPGSHDPGAPRYTSSALDPARLRSSHAAAYAVGLRLPGVHCTEIWSDSAPWATGRTQLRDEDGSYAHCRYADWEAPHAAAQAGPRDLWHEAVAAHQWWLDAGQPDLDRLGLTVTPDGRHHAWLDEPGNSWRLRRAAAPTRTITESPRTDR